jgi:hypothetical protein
MTRLYRRSPAVDVLSIGEGRALAARYPFESAAFRPCGNVVTTGTRATGLYRFTCNRLAEHTGPHLAYAPGPIVVATWEGTP